MMTAFENLTSVFRKEGDSKQDNDDNEVPIPCGNMNDPKFIDTRAIKLIAYIDDLFLRPKVQERFPLKPRVLHTADINFLLDDQQNKMCLGSGQMGTVYLGCIKESGKTVALKVATDSRCDINFMIHEAALMTHLNDTGSTPFCHGVVPLATSTAEIPTPVLVMDIAGGDPGTPPEDLESFIKKNRGKLSLRTWKYFFMQMCEQIYKIHRKGVIMNDIKEENMLVSRTDFDSFIIQMIDFGSSKFGNYSFPIDPKLTRAEFREEYSHVAPEIYMEQRVNEITDVFSLGSIFCEAGRYLGMGDLIFIGIRCNRLDPAMRPNMRQIIEMLSQMDE